MTRRPGRPLRGARDPADAAPVAARSCCARRGAAVAAVRAHADLEFVNGGGTGSLAATAADPAVTEVDRRLRPLRADAVRRLPRLAADARRRSSPLSVVRRPGAGHGHRARRRLDRVRPGRRQPAARPGLPAGPAAGRRPRAPARCRRRWPGAAAAELRIGDRVWFRHAKAGELCEHVDDLQLLVGRAITGDACPTYRGESPGLPLTLRSRIRPADAQLRVLG